MASGSRRTCGRLPPPPPLVTPPPPMTVAERTAIAERLSSLYTQQLYVRESATSELHPRRSARNAPRSCSTRWPPGRSPVREEFWSHTDLWDFQANLEGAKVRRSRCCEAVASGARTPSSSTTLDAAVRRARTRCSPRTGSIEAGFKPYDQLSAAEVQALAAAVDAVERAAVQAHDDGHGRRLSGRVPDDPTTDLRPGIPGAQPASPGAPRRLAPGVPRRGGGRRGGDRARRAGGGRRDRPGAAAARRDIDHGPGHSRRRQCATRGRASSRSRTRWRGTTR